MNWWILCAALAAMAAIVAFLVIETYNRLVGLKGNCENAFAQIELQLKRRYDLIPNLVECVKSYMAHEKSTLESVIAARNQAATELKHATDKPQDTNALQTWMGAESAL